MKRLLIAVSAAAALGLAGCETATPYQPLSTSATASGGYSERQIEPNRWTVSFMGNSLTDRRTVETYLLYRSAELTISQGFDWFAIVDRHTDPHTQIYADPAFDTWGFGGWWGPSWRFYRHGGWGGWGYWGGPGFWGPGAFDYREVTRYEATAEIYMGHGPKPANDRRAFDARAVMERLGPTLVRPAPR